MKKGLVAILLALPLLFSQCGVNKQISQAKTLGDCRYSIASADSVYLAGTDVRQFKKLEDINPARFPRLAAGLLTRNIPLDARINLDIINPTNKLAGINQLEYRIVLAGQELFTGFLNQRIEVQPGGGKATVPVRLNANAYQLFTDPKTRDAFMQLVQNLSGAADAQPSKLTIRIKPTLDLGGKQVNYPGYITINQDVTNKILLGR
ncbi:hypothetical protein [Spirosoma utsteinense]|uniref:Late embryogenesis abundant protein LEA-2 subgroup domain-containing protein n=1 Tax=Spirosoma utsteinense TaxID=2585773 RepID=A0ABR6W7H2_9BACT|nr:hypothetical protein [Spirosoma utsteinense]MBC3783898.1 hypothetical protein [Spirosoma utsteinense]MBC3792532.1 hypothetical protein [Spirosoma utsteinense]